MSGVKACPTCGSGNAATSERCWVCGGSLASAGPVARVPKQVTDSGDTLKALGWLGLLSGIGFVTLLVAIELFREWPGLLVPYAVIVLLGFAALARTAWLQTRKSSSEPAAPTVGPGTVAPAGPPAKRTLAEDIALGVTIAFVVLAGFGLLLVAAVVIFFLICLAMLGAGGFH